MDFIPDDLVCGTDDVGFAIRLVYLLDLCQSYLLLERDALLIKI